MSDDTGVPRLEWSLPGFLSDSELEEELVQERLVIFPKEDKDRSKLVARAVKDQGASIELRLGDEYYVTDMKSPKYLSRLEDTLEIPGGQFALLSTYEDVDLPKDCFALISLKSGTKLKGLINVSGFHIDPGFRGRIHYAVFNAGPTSIVLRRHDYLFLVFVYRLRKDAVHWKDRGRRDKLSGELISTLKGRPVSLDSLDREINALKVQMRIFMGLVAALLATVIGLIAKG